MSDLSERVRSYLGGGSPLAALYEEALDTPPEPRFEDENTLDGVLAGIIVVGRARMSVGEMREDDLRRELQDALLPLTVTGTTSELVIPQTAAYTTAQTDRSLEVAAI